MEVIASRRPWETLSSPQQHQSQTLPSISSLTRDVDNLAAEKSQMGTGSLPTPRDSQGSWTGTTGILSASSANSGNPMPYLNSSSNHSPLALSQPYTPTEPNMPGSGYSSHRSSAVPGHSLDLSQHRGSGDYADSRRESTDSRIHQEMNSLRLAGPTSPYNHHSNNASQSSLTSSLQQQRGILVNGNRLSGGNGPISPNWPRHSSSRPLIAGRIAPPIMENPTAANRFAQEPTKGQAWAFPDADLGPGHGKPGSTVSRRNSYASSITNSLYSELNRPLPPGQHELPDHHHHTTIPHDRVSELKDDPDSPNGTTPYSRTPELRVTHKLAERKRRSEMKDCFEQLRVKLPASQNNKASKWETLARAIEYIAQLENSTGQAHDELNKQANTIAQQQEQMRAMETQLKEMASRLNMQPSPIHPPPQTNGFNTAPYMNGHDHVNGEPSRTLPPIISSSAMQGVQYGDSGR